MSQRGWVSLSIVRQQAIPSVATWRWLFITFGILGVVWSAVLFMFMPVTPLTANFLNEEKIIAIERPREKRTGAVNREFKRNQFLEALKDSIVYYGFFHAILCVVPNSGVPFVGALIIKGFGFTPFVSSIHIMPYGLCEIIVLLTSGFITRRYPNMHAVSQIAMCIPAVIGAALVYYLPSDNKAGRLAGFIMGFSNSGLPLSSR